MDSSSIFLCSWENSGFQIVNFHDVLVLVPRDIPAYLHESFGSAFMSVTKLISVQPQQLFQRSIWANNLVNTSDLCFQQVHDWRFMCHADTPHCSNQAARSLQISAMLQYLARVATKSHLLYSLICDSLAYALRSSSELPFYGAIGILAQDMRVWQAVAEEMRRKTSFVATSVNDGRALRIHYSQTSSTFVDLLPLPDGAKWVLQQVKYGPAHSFSVHMGTKAEIQELEAMCHACSECHSKPSSLGERARLRNLNTGLCIEHEAGHLVLKECNAQVRSALKAHAHHI
jgi:hypothetical protein